MQDKIVKLLANVFNVMSKIVFGAAIIWMDLIGALNAKKVLNLQIMIKNAYQMNLVEIVKIVEMIKRIKVAVNSQLEQSLELLLDAWS